MPKKDKKKEKESQAAAAAAEASKARAFEQRQKAIFEGARQGQLELLQAVLQTMEKSAVIRIANSRNEANRSPLHLASANGHTEVVKFLLECKSNANYRDEQGFTPLLHAMKVGALPTCEALLTMPKYTDVEGGDHEKKAPLHYWATLVSPSSKATYSNIFALLLEKNAPIDAQDHEGNTPLHIACQCGNREAEILLVQRGAQLLPNQAGKLPAVSQEVQLGGGGADVKPVQEIPSGLEELSYLVVAENAESLEASYHELSWLGERFSSSLDLLGAVKGDHNCIILPCDSTAGPFSESAGLSHVILTMLEKVHGPCADQIAQAMSDEWGGELPIGSALLFRASPKMYFIVVATGHDPTLPCMGLCAYTAMRTCLLRIRQHNKAVAAGEEGATAIGSVIVPVFTCSMRVPSEILYQVGQAVRQLQYIRKPLVSGPQMELQLQTIATPPSLSRAERMALVQEALLGSRLEERGIFSLEEVGFLAAWAADSSNKRLQLTAIKLILKLLLGKVSLSLAGFSLSDVRGRLFSREASCLPAILQLAEEDKIKAHAVLQPEELDIGESIGVGATAIVYKAGLNGTAVALKEFKAEEDLRSVRRELALMSMLQHPCLLPLLGAGMRGAQLFAVSPFKSKGDLHSVIARERPDFAAALGMARDTALGMLYLHQMGIMHRDLKPLNLLVSEENDVCIADYGTFDFANSSAQVSGAVGTAAWMAPEVIQNKQFTDKADVYSFAMCLFELFSGEVPFSDLQSFNVPVAVCKGNRPVLPKDTPKAVTKLIQQCWHDKPAKRPSFSRILQHLDQARAEL